MDIIDEGRIKRVLVDYRDPSKWKIKGILKKALELKGLELDDVACLLNINSSDVQELYDTAFKIKNKIYGNRLVIFAPIYVSNYCVNDCLYCGFRGSNKEMKRKILSEAEIRKEVEVLQKQGHKRLLMLMGEAFDKYSFDDFLKALKVVYSVKSSEGGEIRRINVEVPPLNDAEFKKLKEAKIGTYTMFQETYHRETYEKMHLSGMKKFYDWRLDTMDRALDAGIGDIGIGVLFGLYDYKFEVLALLMHANHLDGKYGIGPHTISVPRIEEALNAPATVDVPNPVSDEEFKKIVAVLRCAVPYTGLILSTRESAKLRKELFQLGVSQISAGSKTKPGGYSEVENNSDEEQFALSDTRPTPEVIKDMMKKGFISSFCTSCYRKGRIGKSFMELAKPGLIQKYCQPNALLTLKEYLMDYGDEEGKKIGEKLIEKESERIVDNKIKVEFFKKLERIEEGERDLYF